METPTIESPQTVEGQVPTSGTPQVTDPGAQVPGQPQSTVPGQVEPGAQTPSQDQPGKASEFETARQIKRLEKTVRSLIQSVSERNSVPTQSPGSPSAASAKAPITQQELLADPLGTITKIIDERDQRLMSSIPGMLSARDQERMHDIGRQEGWKIIKSNDAFKRDPEGQDRINEILLEEDESGNSIQKYSMVNPVHAAKLALAEYQMRFGGGKSPVTGTTKAQMVSTATASYPGGSKVDIGQEALKLQREAMDNPDLMRDPQWIARLEAVKKQFNQAKFGTPNAS